ncbi:Hypothetical protein SRAE_1000151300 [Strongyloides ratti]|uniref:Uncharacterized protein n=1 Tax=Strongyloides ratti TaxID=34506 RepID=A0A090L0H2_STRRB|nr:Hypothetical protein SRAE_1000151300 [Strongyloides ratti]CEF63250.1 Hypothetical protein SRAE_1000151300 [Strongyloides ratti]
MSFPVDPECFISLDPFSKQENQIMSTFELAPPDPSEDSTPIDPFQSTVSDSQNISTMLSPDFEPQNNSTESSLPPGFEPRQNNSIPELNIEFSNSNNNTRARFDDPEEPSSSRLSPPPPLPLSQEHQSSVLIGLGTHHHLQTGQDDITYTSVNNSNINNDFVVSSLITTKTSIDKDNESRLLQYRLNKRVESFRNNKREECTKKSPKNLATPKVSTLISSKNNLSNSDDGNLLIGNSSQNISTSTSTLKRTAEQINTSKEESLEQINEVNEEVLIDLTKRKRQEGKEIENSSKEISNFDYQCDIAGNGRNTEETDKIDNVTMSLPSSISSKFIDGSCKKYL